MPAASRGTRIIDCWRCAGCGGIGLAHEDEQAAARAARARGPPLAPVDDVRRRRRARSSFRCWWRRSRRRAARSSRTPSGWCPASSGSSHSRFCCRGAVALERLHVAGIGGGAVEDLRRPAARGPSSRTAARSRGWSGPHRGASRAGTGSTARQRAPCACRSSRSSGSSQRLAPRAAVVALLVRIDVLVHERAEASEVIAALPAEFEIHVAHLPKPWLRLYLFPLAHALVEQHAGGHRHVEALDRAALRQPHHEVAVLRASGAAVRRPPHPAPAPPLP